MLRLLAGIAIAIGFVPDAVAQGPARQVRPASPKMLVLQSGRIVRGKLRATVGGYVMVDNAGQIFIPFTQVRFTADDVSDAYRKLAASVDEPTADTHLALAKWCVSQRLYSQAKSETRKALVLEPNRPEARRMLVRIDEILNPTAPKPRTTPKSRPKVVIGAADTLSGLSRATVAEFTQKIHPLMRRKCGNASCHGGRKETGFNISNYRGIGFQRITEKNLAAVLRYVNPNRPRESRLLTTFRTGNRAHSPRLFAGQTGTKQLQMLQKWIERVATDKQGKPASTPAAQPRVPRLNSFASSVPDSDPISDSVPDSKTIRHESADPFDPTEFNRQIRRPPPTPRR